eukprot:5793987-Prymnesium_polylepis.1
MGVLLIELDHVSANKHIRTRAIIGSAVAATGTPESERQQLFPVHDTVEAYKDILEQRLALRMPHKRLAGAVDAKLLELQAKIILLRSI